MRSWLPINTYGYGLVVGLVAVNVLLCWPTITLADTTAPSLAETSLCGSSGAGEANMQADDYVTEPVQRYTLEQPFGSVASVKDMAEYVQLAYTFALGLVGMMGVVLIMFGGLRWLGAAGNEQAIGEAKEIITSAVTGIIIALLSYSILIFLNPQTLKTGVAILKIPVATSCPYTVATVQMASVDSYLDGRSVPTCQSYSDALTAVATNIPNITECVSGGCKIIVSNSYRTAESQVPLYECYQEKLSTGECSASCLNRGYSCNQAAKPCCSNHQKGLAADLELEYTGSDATIAKYGSASGISLDFKQEDNIADGSPRGKNQALLKKIMTANGSFTRFETSGGKSFPEAGEWWHFDSVNKQCGVSSGLQCTKHGTAINSDAAANVYCQATFDDGIHYGYASCISQGDCVDCGTANSGIGSCTGLSATGASTAWTIIGNCSSGAYVFDETTRVAAVTSDRANQYSKAPDCTPALAP